MLICKNRSTITFQIEMNRIVRIDMCPVFRLRLIMAFYHCIFYASNNLLGQIYITNIPIIPGESLKPTNFCLFHSFPFTFLFLSLFFVWIVFVPISNTNNKIRTMFWNKWKLIRHSNINFLENSTFTQIIISYCQIVCILLTNFA